MPMRKKRIARAVVVALVLAILLAPVRYQVKDGGSVIYSALTYKIYFWHQLTGVEGELVTGTTVELFRIFTLYERKQINAT